MPALGIKALEPHQPKINYPKGHKPKEHNRLTDLLKDAVAYRRRNEIEWVLNLAFVQGKQWLWWDEHQQRMRVRNAKPWEVRAIYNKTRVYLQDRAGMLLRMYPGLSTKPQSPDPEDEVAAKNYEQWLKYTEERTGYDYERAEMMWWLVQCGNAAIKVFWDPAAGPENLVPAYKNGKVDLAEKCEVCKGTGVDPITAPRAGDDDLSRALAAMNTTACPFCEGLGGTPNVEVSRQGDVQLQSISPFDLYWPRGTRRADKAEGVFERWIGTVQEAQRLFPEGADYFKPSRIADPIPGIHFVASDAEFTTFSDQQYFEDNHVEVYTYYSKPTTKYSNGHVWRFTKEFMFDDFDYPEPETGWHPFIWYTDLVRSGSIYGGSCVTDMRNMQTQFNRFISQIGEAGNIASRPTFMEPYGANVAGLADYPMPGEKLRYNGQNLGGAEPHYLQPPRFPDWLMQMFPFYDESLREQAMVGTESFGSKATGRLLAIAQEQTAKVNALQEVMHRRLNAQVGKRAIKLAERYYEDERTFTIIGRAGFPEFGSFGPSTRRSSVDIDVIVSEGSLMPDSKMARIETVAQFLAPLMVDPATGQMDQERVLSLMDIGSPDIDRKRMHRDKQIRENQWMRKTGQPLPINEADDDALHLEEIDREMILHPVGSPEYNALLPHRQQHQMRLQQKQMQQMMASHQQIAGGNAPDPTATYQPGQQPVAATGETAEQIVSSTDVAAEASALRADPGT